MPLAALWRDQTDRGMHAMRAAGQQPKTLRRLRRDLAFRQDAAPDADHGVGGENIAVGELGSRRRDPGGGAGLLAREARRERARQFGLAGRFIEIAGQKRIRLDPDLLQQFEAARRRRGQNEPWPPFAAFKGCGLRLLGRWRRARMRGAGHDDDPRSKPPPRRRSRAIKIGSLETIGDAALGQIIGRHFDENLVAGEDADAVLAHFSGRMSNNFVFVFKLHPKCRIRQQLDDNPGNSSNSSFDICFLMLQRSAFGAPGRCGRRPR